MVNWEGLRLHQKYVKSSILTIILKKLYYFIFIKILTDPPLLFCDEPTSGLGKESYSILLQKFICCFLDRSWMFMIVHDRYDRSWTITPSQWSCQCQSMSVNVRQCQIKSDKIGHYRTLSDIIGHNRTLTVIISKFYVIWRNFIK